MFICGNDNDAKKEVAIILEQFGWESADFGFAESARAIEPLCILWCIPGMIRNEWQHAFKLLKMQVSGKFLAVSKKAITFAMAFDIRLIVH